MNITCQATAMRLRGRVAASGRQASTVSRGRGKQWRLHGPPMLQTPPPLSSSRHRRVLQPNTLLFCNTQRESGSALSSPSVRVCVCACYTPHHSLSLSGHAHFVRPMGHSQWSSFTNDMVPTHTYTQHFGGGILAKILPGNLRMREGRICWSIGRRAPYSSDASLHPRFFFWKSHTCSRSFNLNISSFVPWSLRLTRRKGKKKTTPSFTSQYIDKNKRERSSVLLFIIYSV